MTFSPAPENLLNYIKESDNAEEFAMLIERSFEQAAYFENENGSGFVFLPSAFVIFKEIAKRFGNKPIIDGFLFWMRNHIFVEDSNKAIDNITNNFNGYIGRWSTGDDEHFATIESDALALFAERVMNEVLSKDGTIETFYLCRLEGRNNSDERREILIATIACDGVSEQSHFCYNPHVGNIEDVILSNFSYHFK